MSQQALMEVELYAFASSSVNSKARFWACAAPASSPAARRRDISGSTTVPMAHPTNPRITARVVIFPNLGHDDVHF